ncbi:sugar ABC transporter permease [Cohnella sp. CBP 2801]|uniref:Sugar ABC transporter permease n=2 Tax=Cohnella zeiphila TaxID=2761120 RepID=A0A7X0VWV3_9BACL|nr:sugar ABC transporter permease [Cohnella zeiphila]
MTPFYLMILPGLLFFLLFKYVPMLGVVIAFQNYNPFQGFQGSEWVGLQHFRELFQERDFLVLLRNTLWLNLLDLLLFFPIPIVLAVMLGELRSRRMSALIQTVMYAPHFLSWVVIVGVTFVLFSAQSGGVNQLLQAAGLPRLEVLTDPAAFRWVWLLQNIWQGSGWSAILFLAALASINPTLYEASRIDGAGRLRQIWHISLPGLKQLIVILFILRLGHFMDLGFEHILLLQNPLNMSTSDVFDTFVYRKGIVRGDFSYTTAVGLFKSLVGLLLVVMSNKLAARSGQEGVI